MAKLLVQGIQISGEVPSNARIRLAGLAISGEVVVLSDLYALTATGWQPILMLSWDSGEWR